MSPDPFVPHPVPVVRLGNDLVRNLAPLHPTQAEGAAAVAGHITRFWEARMQRALVEHVRSGKNGVSPVLADAAALLEMGPEDEVPVGR